MKNLQKRLSRLALPVLSGLALASWNACVLADPDAADRAALVDLRRMVESERAADTEFALERALGRRRVEFAFHWVNHPEDRSDTITLDEWLAVNGRPEGIARDEWRALQRFFCPNRKCDRFWSSSGYTLLDLDGDGKRDLIFEFSDGGSGHCTDYSVWRRQGKGFEKKSDDEVQELFSICTRGSGANTQARWIRLRGRLYVALVRGRTGLDRVALLRPFHYGILDQDASPLELRVFYRYRLEDGAGQIAGDFRESLEQALNAAVPRHDENARDESSPLCPIPENASEEERHGYRYGYADPSEWVFEPIFFPLWWNGKCHVVSTTTAYGWYDTNKGLQISQEGGPFAFYPELPDEFEFLRKIKVRRETLRVE
jgi:hypothetical protein